MQVINKKICSQCGKEKLVIHFYRRYAICKFCYNTARGNNRIENLRKKRDIDWTKYSRAFWGNYEEIKYPSVDPTNENLIRIKDQYCNIFGCGSKLKLVEKLCGKLCIKHMNNNQLIYHNGKL